MTGRLHGKVAIVTGGASGIGAASARLMVAEGARVVIADLNVEGASALAAELGEAAVAQCADVRVEADVAALVDTALTAFGRLDVLHNNAVAPLDADTDAVRTPDEAWQGMFDVIVMAAVRGCRHAIPAMQRTGGGSIVNMSSGAARSATGSKIAYGAMKAGLETFSLYTANTFGVQGIRSNVVAPGFVLTEATREIFDEAGIERFAQKLRSWAPLHPRRRSRGRGVSRVGRGPLRQRTGSQRQRRRQPQYQLVTLRLSRIGVETQGRA